MRRGLRPGSRVTTRRVFGAMHNIKPVGDERAGRSTSPTRGRNLKTTRAWVQGYAGLRDVGCQIGPP